MNLRFSFVLVLPAMLLASCRESSGPKAGLVKGVVRLQDTWGNNLPDNSGARVTIEGTNRIATTSADGRWEFPNAPLGVQSFKFEKSGFGNFEVLNLDVDGDLELADTTYLAQSPTATLTIDGVRVTTEFGDSAFVVAAHLSSSPPAIAKFTVGVLFVGSTPAVSPDITKYGEWHGSLAFGATTELTFVIFIKGYRNRFQKGQTLYARAYAYSAACMCYDDPSTGMRILPNTGPQSNIVEFVMP